MNLSLTILLTLLLSAPLVTASEHAPGTPAESSATAGRAASTLSGVAAKTAAGHRALEVVALINSGDRKAAADYVTAAFAPAFRDMAPLAMHLDFLAELHYESGGVLVHEIEESGDSASVLLREYRSGGLTRLDVMVERESPHRIAGLGKRPASETQQARPTPVSSHKAFVERLDTFVSRLAEEDRFSGVVLVARGAKPVFHEAYGLASREFEAPNRTTTRISLGSVNKMFTAVAVLRLVEQGRIDLEDTVAELLPGVLPADVAAQVQIRHLLTHTSGLGDFLFTPEMAEKNRARFRSVADYLPLLVNERPEFAPGSEWRYSNTGFLLLGAIIEQVAGEDYYRHLQRTLFEPLQMSATGFFLLDRVNPDLAEGYERGYTSEGPYWHNVRYEQVVRGTPAGGGYATAADLLKFVDALRSHELLSGDMTRAMLSTKPELSSPHYGYGVQIFTDGGERVGHSGGGPGTAAWVEFEAGGDAVIIVLSNTDRGTEMSRVVKKARALLGAG